MVAVAAMVGLSSSACRGPELPAGYELPYGASPFAPSELRLAGGGLMPSGALAGSADCAPCHAEITAHWGASLHRASSLDPNYRFPVDRMAAEYGSASTRLCEACHAPGAVLAGEVDGETPRDLATHREGVSCLACHLAEAVHDVAGIHVPANASLTYGQLDRDVLVPPLDANRTLLARHALALRRPWLSENRFCDACHRFFVPPALGGSPAGRLRLQSAEAAGTPFGDPEAPGYRSCVDCHMPRIPGTDPAAKDGLIHDHRALGSNLLVPTLLGDAAQVDATLAFRRAGAVSLDLGALEHDPAGGLRLPVTLTNARNGHDFPTGATDVSEAWLELSLYGADGALLYESPGLDADRFLSPDAPSLTTLVLRQGGDLDALHDLFSQVEVRRHVRVRPGAALTLHVPVSLPEGTQAPMKARVTLRARHGNERWNRWVFNWTDVVVPVADLAWAERDLAVPASPAPAPPAAPAPQPPEGMVYVPGGTYRIGADPHVDPEAGLNEYPPHDVSLKPYFLDRVPVTNERFAAAVARGLVSAPASEEGPPLDRHAWREGLPPDGLLQHPVVLVFYEDAVAYCESLGRRLPTEAEWEAAARGKDGRRYPWGDVFDPALCNTAEAGRHHSLPVGSTPANASPFGVLDLGCNVAEWTAGRYVAYPRVRHVDNRYEWEEFYDGYYAATRGASYESLSWRARASYRGIEEATTRSAENRTRKLVGFRCAADVPEDVP